MTMPNCQTYGRNQNNYQFKSRCAKCDDDHHIEDCTKDHNSPAKCALCTKNHTAN